MPGLLSFLFALSAWVFIFYMKYRHKKKIKNRIEYRKAYEMSPEEVRQSGIRSPR